jgi:hypothetical protein
VIDSQNFWAIFSQTPLVTLASFVFHRRIVTQIEGWSLFCIHDVIRHAAIQ